MSHVKRTLHLSPWHPTWHVNSMSLPNPDAGVGHHFWCPDSTHRRHSTCAIGVFRYQDSSTPEVETCDLKGSIPEVFNLFNNLRKRRFAFRPSDYLIKVMPSFTKTWHGLPSFSGVVRAATLSLQFTLPYLPCLAALNTVSRLSAGASALALQLCAVGWERSGFWKFGFQGAKTNVTNVQIVIDNLSSPPKPTQIRPAKLVESRHLYTAAWLKIDDVLWFFKMILFHDGSFYFMMFHDIYYPKCNFFLPRMEYGQYWWTTTDIDGYWWFTMV